MVYKWNNVHLKTDANVAGKVCEELTASVGLTAENLVEASRPEDAPLHSEFEWEDSVAAEEWRKSQARFIIRHLVTEIEKVESEPVRAFFTTRKGFEKGQEFYPIAQFVASKEKMNSLLDLALRELIAFKRKYKLLRELSVVFDAIDSAVEQLGIEEED